MVSRARNLAVLHRVLDVAALIAVPRRCAGQVHTAKQSHGKGPETCRIAALLCTVLDPYFLFTGLLSSNSVYLFLFKSPTF